MIGLVLAALAAPQSAPTFSRDVAPIVFARCAACHRPGESAPFDLLTYRDVAKRAELVADVTSARYMPPWLPAPGHRAFEGDRSLSEAEIETLRRWVDAGAPEGDPAATPPAPAWPEAWPLGEPDLVLEPPAPFVLGVDGPDVFRNLVLPSSVDRTRFVRAVDLRPGNPSVHHAILQVARTAACRTLDAEDEAPGFPGMSMASSEPPDGHFLGWTPGRVPRELAPDMPWRLGPTDDLVLQLHLTRTGKEEQVEPRVGLYFTDRPPTRFPFSIVLLNDDIDIPAGDPAHAVRDEYVLPTDVVVHGVYPHAHYLGKRVRLTAYAEDPGDERGDELLRIDHWDFNWQDEYVYAEPFELAAGTRLVMEWTFDNSAANVRNPSSPPVRVRYGLRSEDEMATVTLNVVPRRPEDLALLWKKRWRDAIESKPWDWHAYNALAAILIDEEDYEAAELLLAEALSLRPEYPDALTNAGNVLARRGDHLRAVALFERALATEPDHEDANVHLGSSLDGMGRTDDAIAHLRDVIARLPHLYRAHIELGNLLALNGAPRQAIDHYQAALRLHPGLPEAHNNLANTWLVLDEPDRAIAEYRRAIAARPDYFNATFNLGRILLHVGRREEGLERLREAVALRPDFEPASEALRDAEAGGG